MRVKKEGELESLVSAEFGENWPECKHSHPLCVLMIASLQLMHSKVIWLFEVNRLAVTHAQMFMGDVMHGFSLRLLLVTLTDFLLYFIQKTYKKIIGSLTLFQKS